MNLLSSFIIFLFLFLIKIYKLFLSPFFGQQCRFEPTCSKYSEEAIKKHGSYGGIFLTIKRLFKCHPWGKSGYDPVPDNIEL